MHIAISFINSSGSKSFLWMVFKPTVFIKKKQKKTRFIELYAKSYKHNQ